MSKAASASPTFRRSTPIVGLLLTVLLLALHHWYGVTSGEIYPAFLLFLFMFGGLAAAGSVHPPLFYSLGKYGQHLSIGHKVIAAACALLSTAVGFYVLIRFY
jgi:hypothetical protein